MLGTYTVFSIVLVLATNIDRNFGDSEDISDIYNPSNANNFYTCGADVVIKHTLKPLVSLNIPLNILPGR